MRMKQITQGGVAWPLFLSLLMGLFLLGCDEAPFEPPPKGPEGYKVYFHSEENPERWYTYYPESDYLDSLTLPTPLGWRAVISPNGDRLYLSRNLGYGLLVIDLETEGLVTELPYGVYYLDLSPTGDLLAIRHSPDFHLVNTTDWSVKFRDSLWPMDYSTFSRDGDSLFGTIHRAYGVAPITEPATVNPEVVSLNGLSLLGGRVLTSPQSDHWYLMAFAGHQRYFIDWNRKNDSVIYCDTTINEYQIHTHHVTRNGKYVAYKNAGYVAWTPRDRPNQFMIYDTELHQVTDTVDTRIFHETGDTTFFNVDELVLTPDSKWLVGITRSSSSYFVVYNLEQLKIERFVEIQGEHKLFTLVCQTGL